MKPRAPLIAVALLLTGCTVPGPGESTLAVGDQADLVRTGIGHTIAVGGPKVTPLAVLEDSRCPGTAVCIWAGQVRIRVRVDLGRGSETHELNQGRPIPIADGTLELVEVRPGTVAGRQKPGIAPGDYRFGFRFMGGL